MSEAFMDIGSDLTSHGLTHGKSQKAGKKHGLSSKAWRGTGVSRSPIEAKVTAFQISKTALSPRKLRAIDRMVKKNASGAPRAAIQTSVHSARLGASWARHSEPARRLGHPRVALTVTSLDKAVQSLATLTTDDAQLSVGDLRIHAARLLRRAAVDQSRMSPRIASIALLLSDALLNSPTIEASSSQREALRLGLNLLMDSFVPQEREKELLRALMDSGWEITAPFNHDEFADLIEKVGG